MSFVFYYLLPFVVVLGILIFFHELGHFLIAKYFGVKVLKFSLGFGHKVMGRKIGDTEYLISAVPLGGYVKMLGEGDEEELDLEPEDAQRAFNHQHVLKRMAIVAAGPIFNLVFAVFVFCLFYMVAGYQAMTSEIGQVREGSPAFRAGLLKGDRIVSIDGSPVNEWSQVKKLVQHSAGKTLQVTVLRGDGVLTLGVTPEESVVKNLFGEDVKSALIGVVAAGKFQVIPLSTLGAVKQGIIKTWEVISLTFLTIVKLFERVVPIKTLGGPLLIGQMTGQLARESFLYLVPFMAVISVNLAILNLLPVPILDGGFLVFLIAELFVGKPISLKKRDLAQKVGLFLLILLMAVVMYNDVARLLE